VGELAAPALAGELPLPQDRFQPVAFDPPLADVGAIAVMHYLDKEMLFAWREGPAKGIELSFVTRAKALEHVLHGPLVGGHDIGVGRLVPLASA
jgi:hypothetical protein